MAPDELMQERIARNDARFREANEKIEATADVLGTDMEKVPFLCECADTSCTVILRVSLQDYEHIRSDSRHFLNAPGHHVAAQGVAKVIEEREGYVIVRKVGHAGDVAERLDARSGEDDPEDRIVQQSRPTGG